MSKTGELFICPTPIGNLGDMTLRAISTLKEVDLIACEDTRVTQKLLNHYEISTKLTSYHKFSEKQKSDYLIGLLKDGQNIALVSDAGTPIISDPGSELVKNCLENNIKIIPLPGACAFITAFSASCNNDKDVIFLGFLPKKTNEMQEKLKKYNDINVVLYESPNRLVDTLKTIETTLDNPNVTVGREITKMFEEFKHGSASEIADYYKQKQPKGEIVIIIEPKENLNTENFDINEKINILKTEGFSNKDISKILSTLYKFPKNKINDILMK